MEAISFQDAKQKGCNYLIFNWLPEDDLPLCVKWVDNINRDPKRKACLVRHNHLINVAVDKQPFDKERSYGEREHRLNYHPRKSKQINSGQSESTPEKL